MKQIKRVLSVLIAVIFVVGCFSMSAGAADGFYCTFLNRSTIHLYSEAYYDYCSASIMGARYASKELEVYVYEMGADGYKYLCVNISKSPEGMYAYADLYPYDGYFYDCSESHYTIDGNYYGCMLTAIDSEYSPEPAED